MRAPHSPCRSVDFAKSSHCGTPSLLREGRTFQSCARASEAGTTFAKKLRALGSAGWSWTGSRCSSQNRFEIHPELFNKLIEGAKDGCDPAFLSRALIEIKWVQGDMVEPLTPAASGRGRGTQSLSPWRSRCSVAQCNTGRGSHSLAW